MSASSRPGQPIAAARSGAASFDVRKLRQACKLTKRTQERPWGPDHLEDVHVKEHAPQGRALSLGIRLVRARQYSVEVGKFWVLCRSEQPPLHCGFCSKVGEIKPGLKRILSLVRTTGGRLKRKWKAASLTTAKARSPPSLPPKPHSGTLH